jgi:hypothetical protein
MARPAPQSQERHHDRLLGPQNLRLEILFVDFNDLCFVSVHALGVITIPIIHQAEGVPA